MTVLADLRDLLEKANEDVMWEHEFAAALRNAADDLLFAIAAAEDLLDYAERRHGGDPSLTSEDYYVYRDTMQVALKRLQRESGG